MAREWHGVVLERSQADEPAQCTGLFFRTESKNLKRPGVQKVLEMAEGKMVGAVVVYKLDRMFRSTVDALETTRLFDKWGVSFHSIEETIDTKSAMGKFFFTLTAALAEMEREIIGERTRDVLQRKKANGEVYGHVPFGFKRFKDKLLPNDTEQKIIQTRQRSGAFSQTVNGHHISCRRKTGSDKSVHVHA